MLSMETGAVPQSRSTTPQPRTPMRCQRMERTSMAVLEAKHMCGSFLPEQVGKNNLSQEPGRGLGAGSGRERHSQHFCSCAAQGERCQTTHALLASPITSASVSQEPFHQSQWHLINIKLMWIKGDWDIYVSIPLYHWVWFYFCSHQFDTDTAPLASMTWICI